ncbi:MAG: hypothetical protein M3R25_11935 [Bacteroidota bacterium]|nr:hypothetical protein [Bacteroidota bacterium]
MILQYSTTSLIFLFAATLLMGCINEHMSPSVTQKADAKEFIKNNNQSGFTPEELFYYDRNYPDYILPKDLFQLRLAQAMRYDQSHPRSHRGLEHPWTLQGPGNIGGRVNTIAAHPTNTSIMLLGYSRGGIYRTEDNGATWRPVFDEQSSLAIGHISFDIQSPDTVYATTGDVNISGYPFIGNGLYRSVDTGKTWSFVGLENKGVLSKVLVDPTNNDILYVGSMGFPSHKGDEKGFWRSDNGGQTWSKTLTIDDSTGVIDIAVDPTQPGRIYASGFSRIRTSKYTGTTGPGTGLYRSDNYGLTWVNLVDGLPATPHSRTSIEVTNNGTLFISYIGTVEDGECFGYQESMKSIFRSFDGGLGWEQVNTDPVFGLPCELLGGFGWYFDVLKVNPDNPLDIFLLGVDLYRTLDGGLSWFEAAPTWWLYEVHADKHDLVFNGTEIFLGTDGGAYRQPEDFSSPWSDMENIISTQFYRTTYNPHVPDQYFGGAQDNGTTAGNKDFINEWPRLFGGDGFQPLFDPTEPQWMYFLTQYGDIWFTTDSLLSVDQLTQGLIGTRYWDMPLVMSPHDPKVLFCGANQVYKINMTDSVREWHPISPDLTKGITILGGRYPAITAIAQSSLDASRIYAGTQDAKLWTTNDGGENWVDISEGTPGWIITSITPSTVDPNTVFVTFAGYRENDHSPYILRSDNAGSAWTNIATDIPLLGVNNFMILPDWNDDVLLAATDGGVYVSINAGIKWDRVGTNFPYMPVYDLDYNPIENVIIAATFSRGLMTFPVEELELLNAIANEGEELKPDDILLYPTLANDRVTIRFENSPTFQQFEIRLIDVNGVVFKHLLASIDASNSIILVLDSSIPPGPYFVQVVGSNKSLNTLSFIKL